jgi:hypothetical protein
VSTFTTTTFQNEFLADGATQVNAIVTVTSDDVTDGAAIEATEIILVDVSGSMGADGRISAAKQATKAAISVLRDGVHFAVIAGSGRAEAVYPYPGLAVSSPQTRAEAQAAVDQLRASGGTAISTWLDAAGALFQTRPGSVNHAILLTDGKNEGEKPDRIPAALDRWKGVFQCDCRGVGTSWVVSELRPIAAALLGTVDIVAQPGGLVADFTSMVHAAMGKTSADVRLRVWLPVGAQLMFLKQVAPDVVDLTGARVEVNARSADYPTGAWGAESRDYHVCVEVSPGQVGDEMLAARVSLVTGGGPAGDVVGAQALVRAVWTQDSALSTRINRSVAHYTGQAELADVIAEGLEARKAGDEDTATKKFGRAAQLASASGNTDTQQLLARVVDIDDPVTGKVRLKRQVDTADEMALDTRSTRTVRVGKSI